MKYSMVQEIERASKSVMIFPFHSRARFVEESRYVGMWRTTGFEPLSNEQNDSGDLLFRLLELLKVIKLCK
jgi:hypothetical protein